MTYIFTNACESKDKRYIKKLEEVMAASVIRQLNKVKSTGAKPVTSATFIETRAC